MSIAEEKSRSSDSSPPINSRDKRKYISTNTRRVEDEILIIEDLENHSSSQLHKKLLKTPCRKKFPHAQRYSINTKANHTEIECDDLAKGDFNVYEGGNLTEFFARNNVPHLVSEICLVNDHYILVKMPPTTKLIQRRKSQMECIVEQEEEDLTSTRNVSKQSQREYNSTHSAETNNFRRYFIGNRKSKVSPAKIESNGAEVVAHFNENVQSPKRSWTGGTELEVFNSTKTTIKHLNFKKRQEINDEQHRVKITDLNTPSDNNSERSCHSNGRQLLGSTQKLRTSLHDTVVFEQHCNIVDLLEHESSNKYPFAQHPFPLYTPALKQKLVRRRFNALRWLLKPFRPHPIVKNPKSKIHAVIYKTYFVRWKKPPGDMPNHENSTHTEAEISNELPKLRRSRSAIF